jgi:uroporphyrinogen decarboxylase
METSRDRILKAVDHVQPETTPVNISNLYGVERWYAHFGVSDGPALRSRLGLDVEYARPVYHGVYADQGLDIWGTPLQGVFGADGSGYSGERGGYPLSEATSIAEIERHRWPTPDEFNFDAAARVLRAIPPEKARRLDCKYAMLQPGKEPHECQDGGSWLPLLCSLFNLFGLERTLVNLRIQPALIDAALAKLSDLLLEFTRRALEATRGLADFYFFGDDFASQRGMMLSPELWRRFLKPVYRDLFAAIKRYGVRVWFHSCGQFTPVLPDLVDIGLDVWETVQLHLEGNDPRRLKRDFGRHITFFGGICTQRTLPRGTPEKVQAEVRERIRVLGEGGGYICGPDHGVMPDVPIANVLAMIEAARAYRFLPISGDRP